ncbi:OsmC family protein [Candidatus Sodalis pierantonius str. SOPE]|uniref:OsmC family protein n=1 Tax=Candidatus Sodalis pierantonii str. SOPE TaxID=2342 RepID=W0HN31_9GAMM|nr:OsmC family protein [Candidatus Sodalis pierantonius str. SOPE]
MSGLREYLQVKREKMLAWRKKISADGSQPSTISAQVTAEGRSGVRRIRIKDHQIILDSSPELAGYGLGPGSQEVQLGVLGSCLTHVYLTQAALQSVPLDALSVNVTAEIDHRATQEAFAHLPVWPQNLRYTVQVSSPASDEQLAAVLAAVEKTCPIYDFLIRPQTITGAVQRIQAEG